MKNKKNGFTTVELITSFSLASVVMLILFNVILIMKDNLNDVNIKTNMLVEKDNLSYNINKRLKEKELTSITTCDEADKCYEFTYSDDTSDKLVYSNTGKTITFNNYTFDIIDGITVEEPIITEHYDTMSSTTYNGYFIINIPITLDNKDYSIKVVKHFNTESLSIDLYEYDNNGNMYTKVKYLESTGMQYIDTGYNFVEKSRFIMKARWISMSSSTGSLFGANSGAFEILLAYPDYKTNYLGGSFTYEWHIQEDYEIDLDLKNTSNNLILSVNGEVIRNIAKSVNGKKCYLFGTIALSNQTEISYYADERFYYFKIYNEANLVRDYIPVIDSSNRPCLFDKVSKTCFYNQGTGEFLWG